MNDHTTALEGARDDRTYCVCVTTRDNTTWNAGQGLTRDEAENIIYTIKSTIATLEKQFLDIHEPTLPTLLVSIPTREVIYVTIERR